MPHTNNKEVERIEEIIENIVAGVAEYPHGRLALAVDLREQLRTILHQELQKAREEERERCIDKWNELYGNKAYSPSMITLEFSRFVKDITSNKTNGF